MHIVGGAGALKGPVKQVLIRLTTGLSVEAVEEVLVFDRIGRLTARSFFSSNAIGRHVSRPSPSITIGQDGVSVEDEPVVGADAWACRFVPNVSFGCTGALVARTQVDGAGIPIVTTFLDGSGRLMSRVTYGSDEGSFLTTARQVLSIVPNGSEGTQGESAHDLELCEIKIAYDDQGRFSRQSVLMHGEEVMEYRWQYSQRGEDVVVSRTMRAARLDDERHTYTELDGYGNWSRHTIETRGHQTDERRVIEYWD